MARLRIGQSYWLMPSADEARRGRRCTGTSRPTWRSWAEGWTGCAAALMFARAGARVVLVESKQIRPWQHRRQHGAADAGTRYRPSSISRAGSGRTRRGASGAAAVPRSAACAACCPICMHPPVHGLPSVYFAAAPQAARRLRREVALRRRAGFPCRWLDTDELFRMAGVDAAGAILTPGNAQVDPYRACMAIARAARREGARFFEHSTVQAIDATRDGAVMRLRGARSAPTGSSSPPATRRRGSSRCWRASA
jgi:glycine/D-amino acid oxidase-like deaminating enzyme